MHLTSTKNLGIIATVLFAGMLGACGNVSHKVARDGSGADPLVWPAPASVTPTHVGGTFPNVESLRLIKVGMNKQQIAMLIGAPHFSEGVVGVREWNYLFNFYQKDSGAVEQCQYKILFDEHKLARSFYWEPAACVSRLSPAPAVDNAASAAAKEQAVPKEQVVVFSADALFAFDKADEAHIKPGGRAQLETLAQKIVGAGDGIVSVRVAGYTDRIGGDAYNMALSKKRAETVVRYLVSKGVAQTNLSAEGYGAADPVVGCSESARTALIACLAPNRRVVVTLDQRSYPVAGQPGQKR